MDIRRDFYLEKLIERKHNSLIKVITGIRRCGKSYLQNTIFYHHLPEQGVDVNHIPAPEGTPILAAHSGTVIVSGWNNSYSNQVLLDNGAGLSTRYAHMTQTAVTAGETVTAGQVIGYVGNTGNSTGFRLRFEVILDGVRVDPLGVVNGS